MSNPSYNTSPPQHSPSYQFPEQTIDLKLFIDATIHREDAGIVVTMLEGDPVSFAKYCFLDYLCQQIQRHKYKNDNGHEHNFNDF